MRSNETIATPQALETDELQNALTSEDTESIRLQNFNAGSDVMSAAMDELEKRSYRGYARVRSTVEAFRQCVIEQGRPLEEIIVDRNLSPSDGDNMGHFQQTKHVLFEQMTHNLPQGTNAPSPLAS
ncbi:MAG: hypothetical protein ABIA92_05060 [Patescibacteria group bacterium]